MSQEGIFKYLLLLLFPLKGPEIFGCLIFWLSVSFSLALVLNYSGLRQLLLIEQNFKP